MHRRDSHGDLRPHRSLARPGRREQGYIERSCRIYRRCCGTIDEVIDATSDCTSATVRQFADAMARMTRRIRVVDDLVRLPGRIEDRAQSGVSRHLRWTDGGFAEAVVEAADCK